MGEDQESAKLAGQAKSMISRVKYRQVRPTDIFQCIDLEKSSYSKDEAASKNELQYRQHHAAKFFRCAVLKHDEDEDEDSDEDEIVGFICGTRCELNENDVVCTSHNAQATTLVIKSIVVKETCRREGLGLEMMKEYIAALREGMESLEKPVSRLVLYAKEHMLPLCIQAGFTSVRPSRNPDHTDRRYCLELSLPSSRRMARNEPTSMGKKTGRECYVVDSFADGFGTGNPAAVVLLPKETDAEELAEWMQTVAAEFNLSETAFCWPRNQTKLLSKVLHWNIRYFTPKAEIPLCGHATLASAAVLYQTLNLADDRRIVFHASEDDLTMELAETGPVATSLKTRISMEFPAKPPKELTTREDQAAVRIMLKSAFSCDLDPLYIGVSEIGDVLVELTQDAFHDIGYDKINFKALLEWDGYYRGVIICCRCDDGSKNNGEKKDAAQAPDFLSRFFGPKAGINEDPVTGSAHCVLGPYFSQKLKKETVLGKQKSERGGVVECKVLKDKVRLTGTASTSVSGTMWL